MNAELPEEDDRVKRAPRFDHFWSREEKAVYLSKYGVSGVSGRTQAHPCVLCASRIDRKVEVHRGSQHSVVSHSECLYEDIPALRPKPPEPDSEKSDLNYMVDESRIRALEEKVKWLESKLDHAIEQEARIDLLYDKLSSLLS